MSLNTNTTAIGTTDVPESVFGRFGGSRHFSPFCWGGGSGRRALSTPPPPQVKPTVPFGGMCRQKCMAFIGVQSGRSWERETAPFHFSVSLAMGTTGVSVDDRLNSHSVWGTLVAK